MRRTHILGAFAAAGLLLAACGGDSISENLAEEALERGAGGDADVDFDDDGSFSIETDEGSVSVDEDGNFSVESEDGSFDIDGQSGDLPDDFPDIPMPDDFEVTQSATQSDGDEKVYTALLQVPGEGKDVFDDIVAAYEDDGWEVANTFEGNSEGQFSGGAQFVKADQTVSLSVSPGFDDEDKVTVSLTVSAIPE